MYASGIQLGMDIVYEGWGWNQSPPSTPGRPQDKNSAPDKKPPSSQHGHLTSLFTSLRTIVHSKRLGTAPRPG